VQLINIELQRSLGPLGNGNATGILFLDHGATSLNHRTWSTYTGNNQRRLSGTGIGLNWSNEEGYLGRAYWAYKLGDNIAQSGKDSRTRLWVELGRTY
jgi:hypothetical protein